MFAYKKIVPSTQVLVAMGSCKYVPLLIVLIVPTYLDWGLASSPREEAAAMIFTPIEDAQLFFDKISFLAEGFGTNWAVLPDGNGTARLTFLEEDNPKKRVLTSYTFENASNLVTFVNFKKNDGNVKFHLQDFNDIGFSSTKPTKMIIHGWKANSESSVITGIKDAYMAEKDVNVIGVDWSPISDDWFYPNAAEGTEVVGKVVANLIDSLVSGHNARYEDFHLIGHSLGAHVAGFAGKSTRQKVGRITGLDPALPGFQYSSGPDKRLDASNAKFVDVIHTCAGVLGMSTPVGHVDFYPNGGSVFQPGCDPTSILKNPQACSHSRAHQFFAESISQQADFDAVKCQDWDHFKRNECDKVFTIMGENIPVGTPFGVYYLKTNWESPFSQGHTGLNF